DVLHRGAVEAVGREDLLGDVEQLPPTAGRGEAGGHADHTLIGRDSGRPCRMKGRAASEDLTTQRFQSPAAAGAAPAGPQAGPWSVADHGSPQPVPPHPAPLAQLLIEVSVTTGRM